LDLAEKELPVGSADARKSNSTSTCDDIQSMLMAKPRQGCEARSGPTELTAA